MNRIILLFFILIYIFIIFIFRNFNNLPLFCFTALGTITGLYYGWNNNAIFHQIKEPNEYVKINNLWIHLLCGIIGAISMYIVFNEINFPSFTFKTTFGWQDFIFLLIGMLGYMGLLPRTLWFFASKGEFPK